MATNVIASIGNRAAHNVTVATVAAATVPGHPNAWTLSISSAIHPEIKPGDKIESGGKSYLILSIAPSSIVVAGDVFSSTVAPATGSASSTRAFQAFQAWIDASPHDLVAADVAWTGHVYREGARPNGEWLLTTQITSHNRICDSTRFIHLTAAPGQSFIDNVNQTDLPVRYDPANGVAISFSGNYTNFVYIINRDVAENGVAGTPSNTESRLYVSHLQIKKADKTAGTSLCLGSTIGLRESYFQFDSCLVYNAASKNTKINRLNNCILYLDGESLVRSGSFGALVSSCTVINIGAPVPMIAVLNYATPISHYFNNTAFLGFTQLIDHPTKVDLSKTFNIATDLPAVGFTCPDALTNVVMADCFVSLNPANLDFRLKAGSPLLGKGSSLGNPYNSTMDMLSRARSPTSPSIGAIESVWTPLTPTPPAASALPDRHISRGIARGFERGIV
jgi:hypothetical protein